MHLSNAFALAVGYLFGSIPFAYLLARRHRGIDLRLAGSGNVGAANLLRTTTKRMGMSAMALDVGKGVATVLVARQIESGVAIPAVAGLGAILGHIYPVWLGFRGGKGVATACGVFAVLAPVATAVASLFFVVTVWWTRYVSLGSVVASAVLAPLVYLTGSPEVVVLSAFAAGVTVIGRHRGNLGRVAAGVEHRIGQRG